MKKLSVKVLVNFAKTKILFKNSLDMQHLHRLGMHKIPIFKKNLNYQIAK